MLEGDEGGDDNDDLGNEEDDEIEEIDHAMEMEKKPTIGGGDNEPKSSVASGTRSSTTPLGSRKLMNWVSLFQDREDTMRMENSELAQYSCSRLLRGMEAAEVESDEEKYPMCMYDAELLRFPAEWIKEEEIKKGAQDLPDNIYSLPEL
jgi:hypothetical protein